MSGAFLLADLDGMLGTTEHADLFVVTAGPLAGQSFAGVFNAPYAAPFNVASSSPMFVTKSSHALARDTVGTIGGVSYRLEAAEPDGAGLTSWPLTRM